MLILFLLYFYGFIGIETGKEWELRSGQEKWRTQLYCKESFLFFCILNSFERLVFLFFGVVSCKLCNILYFQYEYSLCIHIITETYLFVLCGFITFCCWCHWAIEGSGMVSKNNSYACLLNLSQNTNIIVVLTFHVK